MTLAPDRRRTETTTAPQAPRARGREAARSSATSRSQRPTPTTSSSGSCGAPASRARTGRRSSSRRTSSSRCRGRRTRRTSSPRSTSAGRSSRRARGAELTVKRERSVKELIDRVVNTDHGLGSRWTATSPGRGERRRSSAELKYLLVNQHLCFNSPVWFNVGRRRTRSARPASSSASTTPSTRSSTGTGPREDLQGRLRLRHQPLEAPQLEGARDGRRACLRACLVHARRRLASPARSSRAARPAARPRWSSSTSTTPTSRSSSGARRRRSARPTRWARPATTCRWTATPGSASSTRTRTTPSASRDEFMRAVLDDGEWQTRYVTTGDAGGDVQGAQADAGHRAGGLGLRRPRHAVPHDDQRLAHLPEHGPDQRLQPLLRVHAPGRQRLQPGVDQPAQVPGRGRQLRRRGVPADDRDQHHGAGDHRRELVLPDGEDHARTLSLTGSWGSGTRTWARC